MKPDALELLRAVAAGETPRDAGGRLGIHPKRVAALCARWDRRRWYDWGVAIDLGWLTPAGLDAARTGKPPGQGTG